MAEMDVDFQAAIQQIAPGIVEQTDQVAVPGESWISSVARAMGTVAMADYQRKLLNVQLDRARQGKPPLQPSEYGLGVQVGVSPQIVLLGLAAIAALVLIARRR
jgi:hypothetical protein